MRVCSLQSPFYSKCPLFLFRRFAGCTMFSANHINTHVFKFQQDISFLRIFFTSECLGIVFPNHMIHKPIHNYKVLNGRAGLSWSYSATYTRIFSSKTLSQAWSWKSPSSTSGESSKGQSASASERVVQNDNSKPSISLHKVVDVTTSVDHVLGGGMKDATSRASITGSTVNKNSQPPTKKENTRPHSGNKKQSKKPSSVTVNSDADPCEGSGRVSPSKQPTNPQKGNPSQAFANNSAGGLLQELGSSFNKSTMKSKRKGKYSKEEAAVKKSDEALVKPQLIDKQISYNKSPQKHESHIDNIIRHEAPAKHGQNDKQNFCNKSPQKHESHIDNVTEPQATLELKQFCPPTGTSVLVKSHVKEHFIMGYPGKVSKRPLYPPTEKSVVVVESLAKAKVIQGYLGSMYEVVASYGHVRGLAARSGSVRPDDGFSMLWEVPTSAWTHLKNIIGALSRAENLILASDPDREGEAISWHIIEMLQQQGVLHKVATVARVVFHEITESAIKSALKDPRNLNENLVNAYLARSALDYLIGFNISPLLWRKLPGCQSAGRVQSAALAIISDRETEIDKFKPQEYWTIEVKFKRNDEANPLSFHSFLSRVGSRKLKQHSIKSEAEANDLRDKVNSSHFTVLDSKRNSLKRNPLPPYITSTLQQDSVNKLRFTATNTMMLAQKLYEGAELASGETTGLITYMRTDGLHISNEAAIEIHSFVVERYGQNYAAESPLKYFKKVKNSQEAHEAIRPTDIRLVPSMLKEILDEDSLKLYNLIWSRTMACQMVPATIDQIQLDIVGTSGKSGVTCRSTCSKSDFLGYRVAYKDEEAFSYIENENEGDAVEAFEALSSLKIGDQVHPHDVELKKHHTQPPPRYSEATLVKKLEDLGIGRPSTYASTLKVLQDRNYVTIKSRVLHPEFRGRMVSAYLSHHFSEVTNYSFTAEMESQLDNVSAGTTEWKSVLDNYWKRFSNNCDLASRVDNRQVEKMLGMAFGDILFSCFTDKSRKCPSCKMGTLIFKVTRFGPGYFIACDRHPNCKFIYGTSVGSAASDDDDVQQLSAKFSEPKLLGLNPGSNEKVLLKKGPYGLYLQLGDNRKGHIPKRISLSAVKDGVSISLEKALELLRFPMELGKHPEDNKPVQLRLSNKGYSVKHRRKYAFLPKKVDPCDFTLEKALELLADAKSCGFQKKNPGHQKKKPNNSKPNSE